MRPRRACACGGKSPPTLRLLHSGRTVTASVHAGACATGPSRHMLGLLACARSAMQLLLAVWPSLAAAAAKEVQVSSRALHAPSVIPGVHAPHSTTVAWTLYCCQTGRLLGAKAQFVVSVQLRKCPVSKPTAGNVAISQRQCTYHHTSYAQV